MRRIIDFFCVFFNSKEHFHIIENNWFNNENHNLMFFRLFSNYYYAFEIYYSIINHDKLFYKKYK